MIFECNDFLIRIIFIGNINSSLMVLRQCFESLRENQSQGTYKVRLRQKKETFLCMSIVSCRHFLLFLKLIDRIGFSSSSYFIREENLSLWFCLTTFSSCANDSSSRIIDNEQWIISSVISNLFCFCHTYRNIFLHISFLFFHYDQFHHRHRQYLSLSLSFWFVRPCASLLLQWRLATTTSFLRFNFNVRMRRLKLHIDLIWIVKSKDNDRNILSSRRIDLFVTFNIIDNSTFTIVYFIDRFILSIDSSASASKRKSHWRSFDFDTCRRENSSIWNSSYPNKIFSNQNEIDQKRFSSSEVNLPRQYHRFDTNLRLRYKRDSLVRLDEDKDQVNVKQIRSKTKQKEKFFQIFLFSSSLDSMYCNNKRILINRSKLFLKMVNWDDLVLL